MKISSAEFVKSARDDSGWPREGLSEVAFAGRSNVGKSSLINRLVNRKSLALTSSTPGKTRSLNFFRVNNRFMFCDLPGYGFARVSKSERSSWKKMVEDYLAGREELAAVVMIIDIRRDPGDEERELTGFVTAHGLTPVVVATKADKMGKPRRKRRLEQIGEALGLSPESVIVFSARTGEGKDRLWKRLMELLAPV